jgi:hypothetical protein
MGHPAVVKVHPQFQADPEFAQHVGTHLTGALGRLDVARVSPEGFMHATWKDRTHCTHGDLLRPKWRRAPAWSLCVNAELIDSHLRRTP